MSVYHMFKRFIEGLNHAIAIVGGLVLLFIGCIMTLEVALRMMGRPTDWVQETSIYLFTGAMMSGMAYTLMKGRHIRVELLFTRLSTRTRNLLDIGTSLVGAAFCAMIALDAWYHLADVYEIGETTATSMRVPLVVKDFPILLGFALLTAQFLIIACDKGIGLVLHNRLTQGHDVTGGGE